MLENYNKLQLKPKTTDELNVALQIIWKDCHTRTRQQDGGELQQVSNCLHGCGCQRWSLQASAVTLSISNSALPSHHRQTGSFQSHTTSEDNAPLRMSRNGVGLSWLK